MHPHAFVVTCGHDQSHRIAGAVGTSPIKPLAIEAGDEVMSVTTVRTPREGTHRADLPYVPALDGVRGVAVLAIMGYQGGAFLTSGGFYSLGSVARLGPDQTS